MLGLLKPFKDHGAFAVAGGFVLGFAVYDISKDVIRATVGWLFGKIRIEGEVGIIMGNVLGIVTTLIVAAVALFIMMFILKGGNPMGDIKAATASGGGDKEEKKDDEKKDD